MQQQIKPTPKELYCSLYPRGGGDEGYSLFASAIMATQGINEDPKNPSPKVAHILITKLRTMSEENIGLTMLGWIQKQRQQAA